METAGPDKLGVGTYYAATGQRKGLPDGTVAPFPRARFLQFCTALKVQSRDYGMLPLRLLQSQMYALDEICRALDNGITTILILKNRQAGISTLLLAIDLFWAFEYSGLLGQIITQDEAARDNFRNQMEVFLGGLPKGYQVPKKTGNRLMFVFKNLSLFRFLIAGTRQSTNKLGRSGGSNFTHATEVAFWGSEADIASMMQTLSELYPHRLYVFESTANGFNHWEEMCEVAKDSPAQHFIFVGWWRDERNEFASTHPLYLKYMPTGRRTPLTPLERKRVKRVKELYGFDITSGQIAWYRFHLENKCKNDQAMMDQEQPWTDDDAFVSTGAQFFSDEGLTDQMRAAKQTMCMPFVFKLTRRFEEIDLLRSSIHRADLKLWEMPSPWGDYTIGHDPAFGTGGDNAAISVMRGYADACVQVAEFTSNTASPHQQAWVLAFLAGLYKNCMVNLELTGPGGGVLRELDVIRERTAEMPVDADPDLHNCLAHMRTFLYRRQDHFGGGVVKHWQMTWGLKDNLMTMFKTGVETGECQIRSLACLAEMQRTVVTEDTKSVKAAGSFHEDRVIAGALAFYAWHEWRRKPMIAQQLTMERAEQIEAQGGEDPVEGLVRRFLSKQKISLHKDQA